MALSTTNGAVAAVTRRFSRTTEGAPRESRRSQRSRESNRSSSRESGTEVSTREELGSEGGKPAVLETDVAVVVDADQGKRTRGVGSSAAAWRSQGPRMPYHANVRAVLLSKMCILQLVFNMTSSVVCSLGLFSFLFAFLETGPYEWYHPNCLGVIVGSSLFVSPALVMILAPAGLPEAVEKKWFFVIRPSDLQEWQRRFLPFLGTHPKLRRGWYRHLVCGLCISTIMIPIPLLLAALVFSDADGKFPTWRLIWFNIAFETVLAVPCTGFGLLGFAMEPNWLRVKAEMSMHENKCKRLGYLILGCIKLFF